MTILAYNILVEKNPLQAQLDQLVSQITIASTEAGTTFIFGETTVSLSGIREEEITDAFKREMLGHLISLNAMRQLAAGHMGVSNLYEEIPEAAPEIDTALSVEVEQDIPKPEWIYLGNTTIQRFIDDVTDLASCTANQKTVLELYARLREFENAIDALGRNQSADGIRLQEASIPALKKTINSPDGIVNTVSQIIQFSAITEEKKQLLLDRLKKDKQTSDAILQQPISLYSIYAKDIIQTFYNNLRSSTIGNLIDSRWINEALNRISTEDWKKLGEKYHMSFISSSHAQDIFFFIRNEYGSYKYPHPENFPTEMSSKLKLLPEPKEDE